MMRKTLACLGLAVLALSPGVGPVARGETNRGINKAGKQIFVVSCAGCHPGGGNVIQHNLPVIASPKLSDFATFDRFVRGPTERDGSRGLMPAFPPSRLTEAQSRELYDYVAGKFKKH